MPFDVVPATSGLAAGAYADLTATFTAYGHDPSNDQRGALRDLLDHLERAADRALPAALHVSVIPAGTGRRKPSPPSPAPIPVF
jgi:hypothetical protein